MKVYLTLSCKTGAYNKVLHDLLKLDIPRGDMFLLFGPVDILIQFRVKNLDEFIEKWFTPISMMGSDESFSKTMTFIAISEGPSIGEEPYAFIFFHTLIQELMKVQKALLDIPEVLTADAVLGQYDVICAIRVRDRPELERTIRHIQENIPGIEESITAIVALST